MVPVPVLWLGTHTHRHITSAPSHTSPLRTLSHITPPHPALDPLPVQIRIKTQSGGYFCVVKVEGGAA